jgi:hypothetical protein
MVHVREGRGQRPKSLANVLGQPSIIWHEIWALGAANHGTEQHRTACNRIQHWKSLFGIITNKANCKWYKTRTTALAGNSTMFHTIERAGFVRKENVSFLDSSHVHDREQLEISLDPLYSTTQKTSSVKKGMVSTSHVVFIGGRLPPKYACTYFAVHLD